MKKTFLVVFKHGAPLEIVADRINVGANSPTIQLFSGPDPIAIFSLGADILGVIEKASLQGGNAQAAEKSK